MNLLGKVRSISHVSETTLQKDRRTRIRHNDGIQVSLFLNFHKLNSSYFLPERKPGKTLGADEVEQIFINVEVHCGTRMA